MAVIAKVAKKAKIAKIAKPAKTAKIAKAAILLDYFINKSNIRYEKNGIYNRHCCDACLMLA